MNYKELINKLRKKDGCQCECLQAAAALETLLVELDSAIEDLMAFRTCSTCKNSVHNRTDTEPCPFRLDCSGQYWEWRGVQKEGRGNDDR